MRMHWKHVVIILILLGRDGSNVLVARRPARIRAFYSRTEHISIYMYNITVTKFNIAHPRYLYKLIESGQPPARPASCNARFERRRYVTNRVLSFRIFRIKLRHSVHLYHNYLSIYWYFFCYNFFKNLVENFFLSALNYKH